ncbi:hypothetical protein [Streptomyces winkii]|uniref:hypothetical protein n=1 Tax=Streptomyces winkii TaxID=3051178 RepID=UPI0028D1FB8E|nr:hypothetical protein [Streptomyces sp. DSM 40971]
MQARRVIATLIGAAALAGIAGTGQAQAAPSLTTHQRAVHVPYPPSSGACWTSRPGRHWYESGEGITSPLTGRQRVCHDGQWLYRDRGGRWAPEPRYQGSYRYVPGVGMV